MHEDSHVQFVDELTVDALFEKLRQEFDERGTYTAEMLKTAKWLLDNDGRAPRTVFAAAYCISQALTELLQNKKTHKDSWETLSRKVTETKKRINIESPTKEERDLFRAVDDLEEFHNSEGMHLTNFKNAIRYLTGSEPLAGQRSPVDVCSITIKRMSRFKHDVRGVKEDDTDTVDTYYKEAIEALSAMFLPLKRRDDIAELAALPEPHKEHANHLKEIMVSPNDFDYFACRMKSPDWLELLDHDMLKPKPDYSPWIIQSIANHMNGERLDAFVSFVNKNWKDWVGESTGPRRLARVGFTIGDSGLPFLVRILQKNHKSREICRYASMACSEATPSNPCVAELANLLLHPDSELGHHDRIITVPEKLVEGMDLRSSSGRIMILVENICKSQEHFYIRPSKSIANLDMHSSRVINVLVGHLHNAVAKGRELGIATPQLAGMLECLPENVKSRLVAWLYSNADDVEHSTLVDFVESSCRDRFPTCDDVSMLDRMKRTGIMESAASRLANVIGRLPNPKNLDRSARQNPSYKEDKRRALWAAGMGSEVNLPGWEKFSDMLNKWIAERDSLIQTHMSSRSSFDEKIFDSEDPYVLAGKIEAWRPGAANGSNPPTAIGICSELKEAIKRMPDKWTEDPVRMIRILRHPTYVAGYFHGLAQVRDSLDKRADKIIRAIRLARRHSWPVTPLNSSPFEYDHGWQNADDAGIHLIEVLAQINARLNSRSLSYVWEIVIKATTDTVSESGKSAEPADTSPESGLDRYNAGQAENMDPTKHGDILEEYMFVATNKPRTRTIQTMIYLIRHAGNQDKVPEQALTVLAEALLLTGQDGIDHRTIIASHAALLYHSVPRWFEQNEPVLFGNEAPPGLARMSFDTYLGWSGPDKIMLEQYLDKMLDAVRRSTYGAMQHLLIGMFWHVDGYDQKYLIKKFINMGPEFVSRAGEQASRILQNETDAELIRHGISFWKDVLNSSPDPKALAGYGTWALISALDRNEWERLTLRTCNMSKGNLDDVWVVAKRMATTHKITETGLTILKLIVRSNLDIFNESLVKKYALEALQISKDDMETQRPWILLRDAMADRGFYPDS